MKLLETLRTLVPLIAGLGIGAIGASLFLDSLPGVDGSAEQRANRLELELQKAQNRIAALEADPETGAARGKRSRGSMREFAEGARNIGEDLRAGRPVSPDDIFRTSKPIIRDLAPIFDRMRIKQQQAAIDQLTGEFARKYHLGPEKTTALKDWFEKKSEEEAKRWSDMLAAQNTRMEDVIRASNDFRPDDGLDGFMEGILPPEQLTAFRADRLAERVERVQQQADTKVQRLDAIVKLDETQRDQIFAQIARNSRDYDPSMVLEGAGGEIPKGTAGAGNADIVALLRPEQRAAYEAERKRRYEEAAKGAAEIGLTLPADWELLDDNY